MKKLMCLLIPVITSGLLFGILFYSVGRAHRSAIASSVSYIGTILVNTLEDELNNDGDCSLREAIEAANTNSEVDACGSGEVLTDTITFDVAGIITVTSQLSVASGGPILIDGGETITTSGGGSNRVWWVEEGGKLILQGMVVVDGFLEEESGAGLNNNGGVVTIIDSVFVGNDAEMCGGLINYGKLIISHSLIADNRDQIYMGGGGGLCNYGQLSIEDSDLSSNRGSGVGGISNSGILTITNSIIIENVANFGGGGIDNNIGGSLMIVNSILWGNSANQGGAINNEGSAVITSSTISENSGIYGGGIRNLQALIVINSTLSGNSAGNYGKGGGIYNEGWTSIQNSTISGNRADANLGMGGGIYNGNATINISYSTFMDNYSDLGGSAINNDRFGFGQVTISGSIVAGIFRNCDGTIIDAGYNLENSSSCGFDPANHSLPNAYPHLGPLQDNGGATWTHALLWHSSALDAGDNDNCSPTDQRGLPRPMDGDGDFVAICDIGAFEAQEPVFPPYVLFLPMIIN